MDERLEVILATLESEGSYVTDDIREITAAIEFLTQEGNGIVRITAPEDGLYELKFKPDGTH